MSDQTVCERKTDGDLRWLPGNEVVRKGRSNYYCAYDNEQSDGRAAFHRSVDIINSPAYIHGNPDMFSGDICGCSGRTFHKDRKGD